MVDDDPEPDENSEIPTAVPDHGVVEVAQGEDQDCDRDQDPEGGDEDGEDRPGLGRVQLDDGELLAAPEGGLVGVGSLGALVREAVGQDEAVFVGEIPAGVAAMLKN